MRDSASYPRLQRGAQLALAAWLDPLFQQQPVGLLQAGAHLWALRHACREQVLAGELQRDVASPVEPLVDNLGTVGAGAIAQLTTRRGDCERLHGRAEHQLEHFEEHLPGVDVVAYEYRAHGHW